VTDLKLELNALMFKRSSCTDKKFFDEKIKNIQANIESFEERIDCHYNK